MKYNQVDGYLKSLGYVMTLDDDLTSTYTKGSVEVRISIAVKAILFVELIIDGSRILYDPLSNIDNLMNHIKQHQRSETIKKLLKNHTIV